MNQELKDFGERVKDNILDYLPENYKNAEPKIGEILKNNGERLLGLTLHTEDSNVAPTFYLESAFKRLEGGESFEAVMTDIAVALDKACQKDIMIEASDVTKMITEFDQAKDHLRCKLVNTEMNEDYLKDKPHTDFQDLSCIYLVDVSVGSPDGGNASVTITNQIMEQYNISTEELHQVAMENMEKNHPHKFQSMNEIIAEMMMGGYLEQGMSAEEAKEAANNMVEMMGGGSEVVMHVLSNEDKLYGAAAMLDTKTMDEIAEKVGGDFYVLPSSVHEVIVVPKDIADKGYEALQDMVHEVNETQVSPEERLSDHVYQYDAANHELVRCDLAAEKNKEKLVNHAETKEERQSTKELLNECKKEAKEREANRPNPEKTKSKKLEIGE